MEDEKRDKTEEVKNMVNARQASRDARRCACGYDERGFVTSRVILAL
jgi:hypothetical protein